MKRYDFHFPVIIIKALGKSIGQFRHIPCVRLLKAYALLHQIHYPQPNILTLFRERGGVDTIDKANDKGICLLFLEFSLFEY